ncbi:DUF6457 domain-containing protein [Actinomadura sp. KC06]|uniref:DUF6457 domain-containing protein n=1 Tax=Actinomadura sp. KC06 TaxID=2530369 RepID=UPI0014046056|nr:DUF6457 domain-containing protein [Actinomadura sp. KC06]
MPVLEDWINAACQELGLERGDIDQGLVLDLARDVAHGVARPGAPVTAYLLGLAVGRGVPARDAAARLTEMAEGWQSAAAAEPAADVPGPAPEVPEQMGGTVLDDA